MSNVEFDVSLCLSAAAAVLSAVCLAEDSEFGEFGVAGVLLVLGTPAWLSSFAINDPESGFIFGFPGNHRSNVCTACCARAQKLLS